MIPYAAFVFDWPSAGGRFYNVNDIENIVYCHGSSISEGKARILGLPIVENEQDMNNLIHLMNALYLRVEWEIS